MPESFKIEEALTKAIESAVEAYAKSTATSLLQGVTSEAIRTMSAEAAGALLGSIAENLLKSILKVQDGVLKRVDSLVREPFETGIRVAHEALGLPAADPEERQFRQSRLHFAVEKLDQAASLAIRNHDSADANTIAVIQALCLSQIVGARTLAQARAQKAILHVESEIGRLSNAIGKLDAQVLQARAAAANELRKLSDWPSNSFALLNPKRPADYQVESDVYTSAAEEFEKRADAMRHRRTGLQHIREVLARV